MILCAAKQPDKHVPVTATLDNIQGNLTGMQQFLHTETQ